MDGIIYTDNKIAGLNSIKVCEFQASGPVQDSLDVGCFLLTANGNTLIQNNSKYIIKLLKNSCTS